MSIFADLGHADLIDPDHVDGPDTPVDADLAWGPGAGTDAVPLTDAEAYHARHAGMCGSWCGRPDLTPADAVVSPSAAGWHDALVARHGKRVARVRTAMPEPDVRARPATEREIPKPAAELVALARAAGWAVAVTYAQGPRAAEESPCAICGRWARINLDGTLRKHGSPATDCPGGPWSAETLIVTKDATGKVKSQKAPCPACARVVGAGKRGAVAKHQTLAVECENVEIDPGAPAWQAVASVRVSATSPRGHRVAADWTQGEADGAWLLLAGDRPRPVGVGDLKATFRRLAVGAAERPAAAGAGQETPEPGTAGKTAPDARPVAGSGAPVAAEDGERSGARLSDDGLYRYALLRRWSDGPAATFVMLNPSTADAETDDPTIRRCIGFARAWGCGALRVVNLYALRSTDPKGLWQVEDPVGPENDDWLTRYAMAAAAQGAPLVAAWGAHARADRVEQVLCLPGMAALRSLGTTAAGAPRHPLYVKGGTALTPWPGRTAAAA